MFDFPANDPSSSDDSDEKFMEDPQEEPEEALEEDPEEDHEETSEEEEEEPEEEPKEAQAIREATRVENIRLRRKGMIRIGVVGYRPSEAIDVLTVYEECQPPGPQGHLVAPSSLLIMPPKMMKRKAAKKMVEEQIAKAIAEYEKTRANLYNAGGSGSVNAGGIHAPKLHG
ncbi:hypothetical protein Tco_1158512, partial [Tanacetum coccineum]